MIYVRSEYSGRHEFLCASGNSLGFRTKFWQIVKRRGDTIESRCTVL